MPHRDSTNPKKTAERLTKPPTLADVAKLAGVSRWVAGAVLNKGTGNTGCSATNREKVIEAAKILNYQPNYAARTLRGKRSQIYGVMVASAGDPLRSFLVEFLDMESNAIGCQILIGTTVGNPVLGPNRFEQCVIDLAQRKVDGVLCAVNSWWEGDRRFLLEMHPNTVFYDDPGIPDTNFVAVDRREVSALAVQRLVSQGKKRIGIALMSQLRETQQKRLRGYQETLAELGMPFCEELVFFGEHYGESYPSYNTVSKKWSFPQEIIAKSLEVLVDAGKADALIAYDDFWAAMSIAQLRKRGKKVPEDVAVIGYLNHYLADWTDPPLTTIDVSHADAAHRMVRMLEEMIENDASGNRNRTQQVLIQPELIIRNSA